MVSARFLAWSITFLLVFSFAQAATIDRAFVHDRLSPDGSLEETITVSLSGNTASSLPLLLPSGALGVRVEGQPVVVENGTVSIPLSCSSCNVTVSYRLEGVASDLGGDVHALERTLQFPASPALLSYKVFLPPGYVVAPSPNDPPVVPAQASFSSDGEHIIVEWTQSSPQLPQRYFIRYDGHEASESVALGNELSEWPVWLLIGILFLVGVALGALIYHVRYRRTLDDEIPYVPASLLSPDEKSLLSQLRSGAKTHQKELGKALGWSKSKVSAVITNLDHKGIVRREKVGRSYVVELIKEIERY